MKPLRKPKIANIAMSEEDFASIERDVVEWAELIAKQLGDTVENVLGTAFDYAARSGESPLEVLVRHQWKKG